MSSHEKPEPIAPEHLKAVLEGLEQARRGEFATPEEVEAFDPERLIGKACRVRVVHAPGRDGTDWANITDLFASKPGAGTAKTTPAFAGKSSTMPDDTPEFEDPFKEE